MKEQVLSAVDRSFYATLKVTLTGGFLLIFSSVAQAVTYYTAVAAGDATENSAILWTRTVDSDSNVGVVTNLKVELSTDSKFRRILRTFYGRTNAARDYTLKINATGLRKNTKYYYRFRSSDGSLSPIGEFKTAPAPTERVPVEFAFSGDADGRWRPYPLTQDFYKLKLDFFVFLGDTMYETEAKGSPAATDPFTDLHQALEDYHRKYRENLEAVTADGEAVLNGDFSSLKTLYASQGMYTILDNHELGNKQFINGGAAPGTPPGRGVDPTNPANDANNTDEFINKTEGFRVLLQAYSDYHPIREKIVFSSDARTNNTQQLYYAQQWGANVIFINLDDRSYRDIRLKKPDGTDDTGPRADNPQRTMLGKTQLQWFKQVLLEAQAKNIPWKIVAISSPIDEVGEDGGKSWIGGYRAERNEILKFIADNRIENVVFLSTDDHQNRINELTYFSDPNNPNSRSVVPGALTIVAGPISAGGPDAIADHSFSNVKSIADKLVEAEIARGIDPIGLDPGFPGLQNVFREGDPNADTLRQPVDFYSPDTFNYAVLKVSKNGKTLSVDVYGIDSYAANTFLTPSQTGKPRRILGFQIQRK